MSPAVIEQIRTDLVAGIGRYEAQRRRRRRTASVVASVASVTALLAVVVSVTTWRGAQDDGRGSQVVTGADPGPAPPLAGLEPVPAPPEAAGGVALSAEVLRGLTPAWTGRELLVVGAIEDPDSLEQTVVALAYDPAERTWRELPPPPVEVGFGTAVAWAGDELVVCCGPAENTAAAAYDPATDAWRMLPDLPLYGFATAAATDDGMAVVVTSDGAAALDPADDESIELAPPPGPNTSGLRSVTDGRDVYVWPAPVARLAAVGARLDPATGQWAALSPPPEAAWPAMPEIVWIDDALVVLGGLPAARGGESERFVAARYDPATDRWTALPEPLPEPEPCECNLGSHASLWTGRDLLVGVGSLASGVSADGVLLAYDPAEDTWRTVGDTAATALTPIAVLGDQVLLGRGDDLYLSTPGWRPPGR